MSRPQEAGKPIVTRKSLIKDMVVPVANAGYLTPSGNGLPDVGHMWMCRCWIQKRLICSRIPGNEFECKQFKRMVRITGGPFTGVSQWMSGNPAPSTGVTGKQNWGEVTTPDERDSSIYEDTN